MSFLPNTCHIKCSYLPTKFEVLYDGEQEKSIVK